MIDLELNIDPVLPKRKDFHIGCIGAGFIMRDCHLVSYRQAGFQPHAITSLDLAESKMVAEKFGIPKVYNSWQQLIADQDVEVLDIAIPPDKQLAVIKEVVKHRHIKGVLCQKPLAMNSREAVEIVRLCDNAGIKIGVNSNMRYDQSMRALKTILSRNYLGEVVLATIEMRAIPHWQDFLKKYDRIEILNMGIHHVDIFRYLFGDPEKITAVTRKDPRTQFTHIDGISQYTFRYQNDLMATSLDDVWAWPGEGAEKDIYIKWRVEGTEGMAQGSIGWPSYPERTPSTLEFTTKQAPNQWFRPKWNSVWFPDAFKGTMAQLLCAIEEDREPEISGRDNLKTMAAIDACYLSIQEGRTVRFSETFKEVE
ncbi:Gfo/Idh/MocA family protein [Sporomusa acidovorans]|uniref:D-apiose dehydrogenase n=1 Tax=Sporomusa acidovorans (strain ATCC 49682 / DSM 3132 / Mol) TaxID=1123286 RepID=A0ABZ3J604_SPOA4|nr:Gfo/Idh/MocA family oxidoreductase [Sporomusa acidovorans]OZC21048.1 1,5-anhydro-D-fructose reductase [Sporomusa acidovorans DSM 3132]SDF17536.1 Predicted dehydrogenase [Sporomusa acidovorans]